MTPHDLRDFDFQDSPVVSTQTIGGCPAEVVIGAGKSGKVVAFHAADDKRLWTLEIGKHNRYSTGPLPAHPVVYCPGSLGGVLTPLAEAANRLYVPWVDVCVKGSATGLARYTPKPAGGLAAVRPSTGAVLWKHRFADLDSGAATVANDIVFTSTFDGTIYALSTANGSVRSTAKAPAGINAFPAVTRTMLLVGAGAPTRAKHPRYELVAYSLPG